MLLEALTDSDENNTTSLMMSNMETTSVTSRKSNKSADKCDKSGSVALVGSSNFVFDCFFKRNQREGQVQGTSGEITGENPPLFVYLNSLMCLSLFMVSLHRTLIQIRILFSSYS